MDSITTPVGSFDADTLQGAAGAIAAYGDLRTEFTDNDCTEAAIAVLDWLVHRPEHGPWPAAIDRCTRIVANASNPDFPYGPELDHDDLLKALGSVVYDAVTSTHLKVSREAIQEALDEGRAER